MASRKTTNLTSGTNSMLPLPVLSYFGDVVTLQPWYEAFAVAFRAGPPHSCPTNRHQDIKEAEYETVLETS